MSILRRVWWINFSPSYSFNDKPKKSRRAGDLLMASLLATSYISNNL